MEETLYVHEMCLCMGVGVGVGVGVGGVGAGVSVGACVGVGVGAGSIGAHLGEREQLDPAAGSLLRPICQVVDPEETDDRKIQRTLRVRVDVPFKPEAPCACLERYLLPLAIIESVASIPRIVVELSA